MDISNLDQEQRILIVMHKTLSKIIRDTTPSSPLHKRALKDETVEDIRQCLNLISAREREIIESQGKSFKERPRYTDEEQTTNVLSFKGFKPKSDDSAGDEK